MIAIAAAWKADKWKRFPTVGELIFLPVVLFILMYLESCITGSSQKFPEVPTSPLDLQVSEDPGGSRRLLEVPKALGSDFLKMLEHLWGSGGSRKTIASTAWKQPKTKSTAPRPRQI